jgi:hypothetical protein
MVPYNPPEHSSLRMAVSVEVQTGGVWVLGPVSVCQFLCQLGLYFLASCCTSLQESQSRGTRINTEDFAVLRFGALCCGVFR